MINPLCLWPWWASSQEGSKQERSKAARHNLDTKDGNPDDGSYQTAQLQTMRQDMVFRVGPDAENIPHLQNIYASLSHPLGPRAAHCPLPGMNRETS